jgi:adenylate cyclase
VFKLRLFGTASLEAPDGVAVTGRAGQGRQLALLAMLALARGRALSRDKLVAVLWPDASPERARPLLSDAVYVLRNALGGEAVRSVGDTLALDAERVASDVARFEDLLDAGLHDEAIGLYGGPLLDGFHVPGSSEFATWVDGERRRLEQRYARALESLGDAAEAAGDVAAAVTWWRRRAAHDPHNGQVALRLMRALDAAGDRAGALQHARIHATLLRDDFDTEPDAEITAYAERLRQPVPAAVSTPARRAAPGSAASSPSPLPALPPPHEPHAPSAVELARTVPDDVRGRRRRLTFLAIPLVALGAAVAIALTLRFNGSDPAPPSARSVAVLPFVNMSADPANNYFSDGLSEQIILALSRIDGLHVAARTSSFALRNSELDVRTIGDTLGVDAVLEGSVLVHGEHLRVIAQLIDARTGFHIWSEQYDGSVGVAFALQDSVALAIASALHLRLAASGTRVPPAAPSLEAYDFYLRGLYLRNSLEADAILQAAEYFDHAIALEPRFAQAWAAKASVLAVQAYFRYADRDSVVAQLRTLTARALELDPESGEAHTSLGILRLLYEWDWDGAQEALRRAIALNPSDAHAWHHLGNYHAALGDAQNALAARETAVQLDPLNARSRIVLASDYAAVGDYTRALREGRRAAELHALNPLLLGRGPSLPAGAPMILWRQGMEADAVTEYVRIATLRQATPAELDAMRAGYATAGMPGFWRAWLAMDVRQSGPLPDPFRMALTLLAAGDTAVALDWLDRAFAERNAALIYLQRDPVLRGMRKHPRVERIAREMRLPG